MFMKIVNFAITEYNIFDCFAETANGTYKSPYCFSAGFTIMALRLAASLMSFKNSQKSVYWFFVTYRSLFRYILNTEPGRASQPTNRTNSLSYSTSQSQKLFKYFILGIVHTH